MRSWYCLSCKNKFPSYTNAIYLCVCPKNQLICSDCVMERSMGYIEAVQMFGKGHNVRNISVGISGTIRDAIRTQQKNPIQSYLESRKSGGWVYLTPNFFYPEKGEKPFPTQKMKKAVMFRGKYEISPFVDILTHIEIEINISTKATIGIFVGETLCKKGRIKQKNKLSIPFFVPLFAMKNNLITILVRPGNININMTLCGYVISDPTIKGSLLKERLWMPETCLTYEKDNITFACPNPLDLAA